MNKPATKEPSMDEILSSIRQIIADDDAAAVLPSVMRPSLAVPAPAAAPRQSVPTPRPAAAAEPLALSAAQIVPTAPPGQPAAAAPPPPSEAPGVDFSAMLAEVEAPEPEPELAPPLAEMLTRGVELVDPEDITFEPEVAPPAGPVAPPVRVAPPPEARAPEPPPSIRTPPPHLVMAEAPAPVSLAAPMPDPTLSAELAEELLAPATDAAVQGTLSRLSSVANGGMGSQTLEGLMRDMLRPMLKDWLDENLPALVERMVEKEIARISRGLK